MSKIEIGIAKYYLNKRATPGLEHSPVGYFEVHEEIRIIDTVKGQKYQGCKTWFLLDNGLYVWSGGVYVEQHKVAFIKKRILDIDHGFADIHCHPIYKIFNELRISKKTPLKTQSPWETTDANLRNLGEGYRAHNYSQCDLAHLVLGKVKVAFAALYPFEKNIMSGYNYASGENKGLPDWMKRKIVNVTKDRQKYVLSKDYDYYDELKAEMNFLKEYSGVRSHRVELPVDMNDDGRIRRSERNLETAGTFYILSQDVSKAKHCGEHNSYKGLDELGKTANGETILALTIEGMHSLSMEDEKKMVSEETLIKRIEEVKSWNPGVFFITFAHHYNNGLCSHARSLPTRSSDQSLNMNFMDGDPDKGFSKIGWKAIRRLLSVDIEGGTVVDKKEWGRRIFVDVKHMSATARKNFYQGIINKRLEDPTMDKIPVIASHVGYSGVKTLQNFIDNYDHEMDKATRLNGVNEFSKWNINLSDEDVEVICKSEGMIGMIFDQRGLGVDFKLLRDGGGISIGGRERLDKKVNDIEVFASNILEMVKRLYDKDATKKLAIYKPDYNDFSVWKALTIGSDFDGAIDPLDDYPTATELNEFRSDLIRFFKKENVLEEVSKYGLNRHNITSMVHDLCLNNAINFLKKHFK